MQARTVSSKLIRINPRFSNEQLEQFWLKLIEMKMSAEQNGDLADVEGAIQRIIRGSYGYCEECDREIAFDQLETHPEARFCVDCEYESAMRGKARLWSRVPNANLCVGSEFWF